MIPLHPFVEHLANKSEMTLDEAAVIGCMKMALYDNHQRYLVLKKYVQELNPHGLSGLELSNWSRDIASYILPEATKNDL